MQCHYICTLSPNTPHLISPLFNMTNYLQPQAWTWEHAAMASTDQFQVETEREYMFEKPLTPSDVGKLNRLVIPKQNAEKYFPIIQDQPGGEKGLLLDFEDETGKPWRFRYSYWSSSQSYVLTKGWSRFVKEKRLDAGDTIVFQRHHVGNLLYIGCRRRGEPRDVAAFASSHAAVARNAVLPWSPPFYSSSASESSFYNSSAAQQHCLAPDNQMSGATESSAATKPVKSRRLRLFGVNVDCGPEV